ncbi:hypothetical protein J6590_039739 [Homalodisca vitripennis]|nr:hypothetical protein J6590_039739 [Homalodisca vitripennis]
MTQPYGKLSRSCPSVLRESRGPISTFAGYHQLACSASQCCHNHRYPRMRIFMNRVHGASRHVLLLWWYILGNEMHFSCVHRLAYNAITFPPRGWPIVGFIVSIPLDCLHYDTCMIVQ